MAKFTVKAGAGLSIDFPARYLIIDSITAEKSLRLRSLDSDLDIDFVVRGGGKISQLPELVTRWRFDNDNGIDVDVVVQGGSVLYDENRLDGYINALTRFDNLTTDGNRFFGGLDAPSGGAGNYGQIAFYNPVGSGVKVYIDVLRICNYGSPIYWWQIGDADLGAFQGSAFVSNKKFGGLDGKSKTYLQYLSNVKIGDNAGISISTDTYGTATPLDFKNSPIELSEGIGINFVGDENKRLTVFAEMFEESI